MLPAAHARRLQQYLDDPHQMELAQYGEPAPQIAAETAQDLGMGLGNALGGYAYDKITSLATDGTVLDAA